jgi:hypothetical protein
VRAAGRYSLVSFLLARKPENETVATRAHFNAGPETVWNRILFYEEVPERPPLLLRALLPEPVRTEGGKTDAGATVRCHYRRGEVVKRITAVARPRLVEFEVIEQRLGIEGCVFALGGSYRIWQCGEGSDVELRTNYRAYLRPRRLWRRLEAHLVSQLHRHILGGIRAGVPVPGTNPSVRPAIPESLTPQCASPGGLACTISKSRSHR